MPWKPDLAHAGTLKNPVLELTRGEESFDSKRPLIKTDCFVPRQIAYCTRCKCLYVDLFRHLIAKTEYTFH